MDFLSALQDLYILATRGLVYSAHLDTLVGLPHFTHDLLLGANPPPKDPQRIYTDLHAHFSPEHKVRDIIEEAAKKVDVLAVINKPQGVDRPILSFTQTLEKLAEEGLTYRSLGPRVVKVTTAHGQLYLVRGMEVPCKENQSVLFVGNRENYTADTFTVREALEEARTTGAFPFLDHPFTIGVPVIAFRYPTKEELQQRREWIDEYQVALEICNSQNTLWMYPSNLLARREARLAEVVGLGNSDLHHNLTDVGQARTSFSRSLFDPSTEESFFASLQQAFSPANRKNVKVDFGYASLWGFGKYMLLPHLKEILKRGK